MNILLISFLAACISTCLNLVINVSSANAQTCDSVKFIFVRGSGEKIHDEHFQRFEEQLNKRLENSQITHSFYDLGAAEQSGYKYPAIDVGNPLNGNAVGAWLSGGKSYDYGNSVRNGILELVAYVNNLQANCPNTHIVLAGYSQGAQVVGEAFRAIMPEAEKKIDFVALFGDPKLHLPEGYGLFAPACRGQNYSPWRRTVGNCFTSAGSLGARNNPYMSKEMETKTGLWCVSHDFICGSSRSILDNSGHKRYADENGPIDNAVREIASILQTKLPKKPAPPSNPGTPDIPAPVEPEPAIDLRPILNNPGADVMLVFDNSLTMTPLSYNNTIRSVFTTIADKTLASGGRIGLLSYCGCNPATSPTYYIQLQGRTQWHPIYYIGYEHDRTTRDLSLSLKNAIERVKATELWRPGVKRIIVPFTNSAFIPPIVTSAKASTYRATFTLESPETIIYPVVSPDVAASFDNLSIPGATTIPATSHSIQELSARLANHMNAQVIAYLTSNDYIAKPGETLYFDASPSQVYNDEITKYEWDFNGDSVYDHSSTSPKTTHKYTTDFSGTAKVRVSTKNGLQSTVSATISISSQIPVIAKAPQNVKAVATSNTTAKLSWEPADNLAISWAISLNDVYIGQLAGDRGSINISELDFKQRNTFGVRAIMAGAQVGEIAQVTLDPGEKETISNATTKNNLTELGLTTPVDASPINTPHTNTPTQRPSSSLAWIWHIGTGALIALVLTAIAIGIIWLHRLKQATT